MLDVAWLIPALPLAGFVLILLFGRRLGDPRAGYLATLMCGGAFVVTVGVYFDLLSKSAEERTHISKVFTWVPVGSLKVDLAFLVDPLSITMCLFVTGVGTLIHLYAIGYMHGDPRFSKFFLYLNLFALSMLVLVLGENMLVTFLGWEGVGTCSYFLIAFWHERESAATAGKKAFVTNRVGDWGFMMAMFFAFQATGTLSYLGINDAAGRISQSTATAIALFAFIGACGKSAQLPLYLWLPDAMEGPTPVSALIHAATMVTAGVYLLVRASPIFEAAPDVQHLAAILGAITLLVAGVIALVQWDIKRVIAYSTMSQIGYMFLAAGIGAYGYAIFHLMTHAFFKALLFLGAGSVIHALSDEQDLRRMGGLASKLPWTHGVMLVATLAIAGLPPLSGFFSKDEILASAFATGHYGVWIVGLLGAALTAFYMFRLYLLCFRGESRLTHEAEHHLHESPPAMTVPLHRNPAGLPIGSHFMARGDEFLHVQRPAQQFPECQSLHLSDSIV
jgi:NADH-quinone oxidoreductase subunit L